MDYQLESAGNRKTLPGIGVEQWLFYPACDDLSRFAGAIGGSVVSVARGAAGAVLRVVVVAAVARCVLVSVAPAVVVVIEINAGALLRVPRCRILAGAGLGARASSIRRCGAKGKRGADQG